MNYEKEIEKLKKENEKLKKENAKLISDASWDLENRRNKEQEERSYWGIFG